MRRARLRKRASQTLNLKKNCSNQPHLSQDSEDQISKCLKLISKSKISEAFLVLLESPSLQIERGEIILLSYRYEEICRRFQNGSIGFSEALSELTRVVYSLIIHLEGFSERY